MHVIEATIRRAVLDMVDEEPTSVKPLKGEWRQQYDTKVQAETFVVEAGGDRYVLKDVKPELFTRDNRWSEENGPTIANAIQLHRTLLSESGVNVPRTQRVLFSQTQTGYHLFELSSFEGTQTFLDALKQGRYATMVWDDDLSWLMCQGLLELFKKATASCRTGIDLHLSNFMGDLSSPTYIDFVPPIVDGLVTIPQPESEQFSQTMWERLTTERELIRRLRFQLSVSFPTAAQVLVKHLQATDQETFYWLTQLPAAQAVRCDGSINKKRARQGLEGLTVYEVDSLREFIEPLGGSGELIHMITPRRGAHDEAARQGRFEHVRHTLLELVDKLP